MTGLKAQTSGGAQLSNGRPDLQGIWQALNTAEWNLEPHEGRPGIPPGMSVVEGGLIPYQPWAAAKRQENLQRRETEDPVSKCYLPGVPRATYMGFPFQIFQSESQVLMLYEYAHTVRTIPTTGKPFAFDGAEFWMGESRGRYEGNSLVVETRNFNDATWFDRAGNFHSEALRVVERYTKTEPNLIMYEARIEDPKVFTRPWTISMPLYRRREPNLQLLEYECYSFPGFEPPTAPARSN
ncbi:MAG: hypothetical protein HYY76_14045 [Acidobacteria bacterium]|nr:hypothetical protein [Acidobacteriota bacterium]